MPKRWCGVVVVTLVLAACGADHPAPTSEATAGEVVRLDAAVPVVDVRTESTLPVVATDPATAAFRVLVGAPTVDDPGLEALTTALAQRPDLAVEVVVPGPEARSTTTPTGYPAEVLPGDLAGVIGQALDARGGSVDLVLLAVGPPDDADRLVAGAAIARQVSLVAVRTEAAPTVDYAAATVELLSVLDERMDLLADGASAHTLAIPSCESGMLRGRVDVDAAPLDGIRSDCTSPLGQPPENAAEAMAVGFASMAPMTDG